MQAQLEQQQRHRLVSQQVHVLLLEAEVHVALFEAEVHAPQAIEYKRAAVGSKHTGTKAREAAAYGHTQLTQAGMEEQGMRQHREGGVLGRLCCDRKTMLLHAEKNKVLLRNVSTEVPPLALLLHSYTMLLNWCSPFRTPPADGLG
eukprot:scaffold123397_cov17-Tisochrysis_lutea.AAC.1